MRPLLVVPRQIVSDRLPCVADGLIGLQIYLFVLHAAPQPFDKNVVSPASLAVHRQSDPTRADRVGEVCTGERRSCPVRTPDCCARSSDRAAGTARSCAPDVCGSSSACDTALRCPFCTSTYRHACVRPLCPLA